jgi:Lrp/AsnC family transcriptional regulator for asnA, asnC and gidA
VIKTQRFGVNGMNKKNKFYNDKFDETDKSILQMLVKDGRMKVLDMARRLRLVGGTIHARLAKFKKNGLIEGYEARLNLKELGYDIQSFVGVTLTKPTEYGHVVDALKQIPNVLEIHYTTGDYSLFLKVIAYNIDHFHELLHYKVQQIDGVESTRTIIALDSPLVRRHPEPLFT